MDREKIIGTMLDACLERISYANFEGGNIEDWHYKQSEFTKDEITEIRKDCEAYADFLLKEWPESANWPENGVEWETAGEVLGNHITNEPLNYADLAECNPDHEFLQDGRAQRLDALTEKKFLAQPAKKAEKPKTPKP